jgi:hypothetical protein
MGYLLTWPTEVWQEIKPREGGCWHWWVRWMNFRGELYKNWRNDVSVWIEKKKEKKAEEIRDSHILISFKITNKNSICNLLAI